MFCLGGLDQRRLLGRHAEVVDRDRDAGLRRVLEADALDVVDDFGRLFVARARRSSARRRS